MDVLELYNKEIPYSQPLGVYLDLRWIDKGPDLEYYSHIEPRGLEGMASSYSKKHFLNLIRGIRNTTQKVLSGELIPNVEEYKKVELKNTLNLTQAIIKALKEE